MLGGGRVKRSMCITVPNFVAIGQTVAEIWRFLKLSKMAAVCHIGFVIRVFGPLTKGICWSLYCANFGWNRCSSFDKMHVYNILQVRLENAYSRPKIGVLSEKGKLGPHLTQYRLGRGLPQYQVAYLSIQPFGHNNQRYKTHRQTTVRSHRANRFTYCRRKKRHDIVFFVSFLSTWRSSRHIKAWFGV